MKTSLLVACVAFAACGDNLPAAAPGDIFAPLGDPVPFATPDQLATFQRGKAVALRRFTQADGLGPNFNVTFCGACHERPAIGGGGGRYRNFLLEGQELGGAFTLTGVNGIVPQFTTDPSQERAPTDPLSNVIATRNPIPFFGVGLLAEIPEEEILSRQDPDDKDGDGIRGIANMETGFVGRFGIKAQNSSIEQFIRGPLFNHMGITSDPLPDSRRAELPVPGAPTTTTRILPVPQVGAPDMPITDDDGVPDPELGEDDLFDLVSFAMLTAPAQPDELSPDAAAGKVLFESAHCTGCHVPALIGPRGPIPAYSDLLLHDMGPDLADGIVMGLATGSQFRTAPLWNVCATGPYLHDGRADTLDDAIRAHGGEATAARESYEAMTDINQAQVVAFIDSLGASTQVTAGLLPPEAAIPDAGTYGAPVADADPQSFANGRTVFDSDFGATAGLGTLFNGDACRSCHADPVIGGAGERGVNVIRYGYLDPGTGQFTPPATGGTIAHHFTLQPGVRPALDPTANVFEARQPPTLFGIGLIDRIPDATIIANADPDDVNGDGIKGRANILPDGRLGRLGWKADVPSVAEFARDAMFNELGITTPAQDGLTFGQTTDDDAASDPEIAGGDLASLVYFMTNLAPPPRTSTDPASEEAGAQVFSTVGCASCHTPSMQTSDGIDVPLFSDLLIHDVAQPWQGGIASGSVGVHEFRTAPLWGLATTAPYMHDGSQPTIEDAILAHGGEAIGVRNAFLALAPADQAALLAFLRSL